MKKVTDTRLRSSEDAAAELGRALSLGDPNRAIEAQEQQGQDELVEADVLPVMGIAEVEALGVEVLDIVEGDELFVYVKLPEGWKKQPTSHSLWTEVVDAEGKIRARVFYKAASYDRKAFVQSV